MRLAPILCLALIATPALADGPDARAAKRAAAVLADKQPGRPQSCISLPLVNGGTIMTPDQIIYEQSSRKVYVNRPPGGCPMLREDRIVISRTPSTQLCRGDIIRIRDSGSPIDFGSCALGDFIPYERAPR